MTEILGMTQQQWDSFQEVLSEESQLKEHGWFEHSEEEGLVLLTGRCEHCDSESCQVDKDQKIELCNNDRCTKFSELQNLKPIEHSCHECGAFCFFDDYGQRVGQKIYWNISQSFTTCEKHEVAAYLESIEESVLTLKSLEVA